MIAIWYHNISSSQVLLEDIGLVIPIGSAVQVYPEKGYDLSTLQESDDTKNNINVANLLVSKDGIHVLSVQDSLDCITAVSEENIDESEEEFVINFHRIVVDANGVPYIDKNGNIYYTSKVN